MDKELEKSDLSVYSVALEKLVKSVLKCGSVIYAPIDQVYEMATKQTDNNLKFPFVSFYQQTGYDINWRGTTMPNYNRGRSTIKQTEKDSRFAINTQSMEITMGYIFEVIAEDRDTVEELLKELLFFFLSQQEVSVKYRDREYLMTFRLDDTFTDNTNLALYSQEGRLYRYSFNIVVSGQLFRSENYFNVCKPIINIVIDTKLKEGLL